jgi:hypothetical protein
MFSTEQKTKAPILQDDMPPGNGGTYSSKEDDKKGMGSFNSDT